MRVRRTRIADPFDGAPVQPIVRQQRRMHSHPLQFLHDVRAKCNGIYGVFSDPVGFDAHSVHVGGRHIVNPEACVIAWTESSVGDGWIAAEVHPQTYEQVRASPWFLLKKRCLGAYGELSNPL